MGSAMKSESSWSTSYVALQEKPCFTFSPLHGVVTCHILNGEMIKGNECNVTGVITKVGRGEMRKERFE